MLPCCPHVWLLNTKMTRVNGLKHLLLEDDVLYWKKKMEKKETHIMGYGYAQKEHMLKCFSASGTIIKDLQADSGVYENKGILKNQNKQHRVSLTWKSSVLWPHSSFTLSLGPSAKCLYFVSHQFVTVTFLKKCPSSVFSAEVA